jgi:hypothetical protein
MRFCSGEDSSQMLIGQQKSLSHGVRLPTNVHLRARPVWKPEISPDLMLSGLLPDWIFYPAYDLPYLGRYGAD